MELVEVPVVQIISSGFGLENVLLKLLRIVVFLDDFLKKILLLVLLCVVHKYIISELSTKSSDEQLIIDFLLAKGALRLLFGTTLAHLLAATGGQHKVVGMVTTLALLHQGVHHI